ncbi:pro-resilin-like [Eriocheir sinensis]|uniref:pro-resilin-like n=1 Tax=Eriocheir sinensis TaxID=95602 RepID=UPI0021C850EC|nr:pro-resilin-like [Eriocheir sinensis]
MYTKVFFLLAGMALALAAPDRPRTSYGPPRDSSSSSFEHFSPSSGSAESGSFESFESSEAKYGFQWSVEDDSTGNDFDHQEARDGDDTQGVYTVQLPDGRRQTVTYHVDGDDGYIAEVTYEGVARYPDSVESYESGSDESSERRVYAPPRRTYLAPDSNESK